MGLLDEPGLEALIGSACEGCASPKRVFHSYVDGIVPIMGGEPVNKVVWAYDGEKFVDGVFEVRCADCNRQQFVADVCPRCHAPGGLEKALGSTNAWPVPTQCPECENEELRYVAMLPARVVYEGKRAEKARSSTELYDEGFHGQRVECKSCGPIARKKECPLCEAPPPLRVRPG